MKAIIATATLLLIGHSAALQADVTTLCTNGKMEREISVVYTNTDSTVPCEVRYRKDGETKTLWNASSQAGYCEEKAEAFIEKQRSWGWKCETASQPEAEAAEATEMETAGTGDDTAAGDEVSAPAVESRSGE